MNSHTYWANTAYKIAYPVLSNLSQGTLRANMPVECHPGKGEGRRRHVHLEAFGRTLAGIAPWLEVEGLDGPEEAQRHELASLARAAIAQGTNPSSPDFLVFEQGTQPVVDAAFLAQGLLRAPRELWEKLDGRLQNQVVDCLKATRAIRPCRNNWLLFSCIIEAFLLSIGANADKMRIDYAIAQHELWYKGDGAYGDGMDFHWDYYNSFVIHPMLLDSLYACAGLCDDWNMYVPVMEERAVRFAEVQERLIGPDGVIPPLGRSLPYRTGALQALGQMALLRRLPKTAPPAAVREAMTAVIHRLLEPAGTFDGNGWLQIGFCGHQPDLAEGYISTGSLYLCLTGFLPLGLPPQDEFWSAPAQSWTSKRVYNGENLPADKALRGPRLTYFPMKSSTA